MQMNGIETALGSTQTATDALVRVHNGSAAAQTSGSFLANLLFRESLLILPEWSRAL